MGNTSTNSALATEFVNHIQPFLAHGSQLRIVLLPYWDNSFQGGLNSTTAPQPMIIDSGMPLTTSSGSMAQHRRPSPRNELQVDIQKIPSMSGATALPPPIALLLLQKARNSQARMILDLSAMLNATAHQIRHLQSITETTTTSMNAMVASKSLSSGFKLKDILAGDAQEGLVYVEDIVATRRDLATLAPNTWLNEHVVNAYVMSLPRAHNKSDVVVVQSFSFAVLEKDTKLFLQMHWARYQDKLIRASKVLVPINITNSHWVLGVVRIASHEVRCEIHDSLSSSLKTQMASLINLAKLTMQARGFAPGTYPLKDDVVRQFRQSNSYDCGLYACRSAENVVKETQMEVPQNYREFILNYLFPQFLLQR